MTPDGAPIPARAAIVHDWLQGYHGSERVVEAMRTDVFGGPIPPDVYTFVAARDRIPSELAAAVTRESALARLPGFRPRASGDGRWRYLLPLMPRYFRGLDLDRYDVVIASSHACAVHARPRADALYVCYCYTPMRYAWLPDLESARTRGAARLPLRLLSGRLRRSDLEASRRPDAYIAISTAVRERIRRFYGREAVVIHPPVDVGDFRPGAQKEPGRFLWVHRLVPYKRPELVMEAFRGLPYRLTMVGVGPMRDDLRKRLPPNVELLDWVERDELARLFELSSGFIHAGEEDFGISMVEALASGTPVIALARGGATDIVRPGVDGVLIERPEVGPLQEAIRSVAERQWDRAALVERAQLFSRARFAERMRDYLAELGEAKTTPSRRR
jgi:glycosyltransferase involved in cell wall biosynthesis